MSKSEGDYGFSFQALAGTRQTQGRNATSARNLQQYGFICFVFYSVSAYCTQMHGRSTFRRVQWVKPTNAARVCGSRFWSSTRILDLCSVPRCEAH
jgi:hypothetical protein